MDNATRSERTKSAVIAAALAIIARDGAGRLTLDAIARESGVSKGGLLHQFPTKRAVLAALLEQQADHYDSFAQAFREAHGADYAEPVLAAQIAAYREVMKGANSITSAILAAIAEDPTFLNPLQEREQQSLALIREQAADPEQALSRLYSAQGLALSTILGLCPLNADARERMFEHLLDESRWLNAPGDGRKSGELPSR